MSLPPQPPRPIAFPGQPGQPVLSVVVPMHNEQANVGPLFRRLQGVLERLGLPYEVVCVDDGSRDGTWAALEAARAANPRVKLLRFSRNFGKEMAMTAGLRQASGRAAVIMDADLQHPPELIEEFVARWREGAQMVYAVRRSRDTDPTLRRHLSELYYRLLGALSEVELPRGAGDFRLLDRAVVDALNAMPERGRFLKGMYSWVGFRQAAVPFDPAPRHAGTSAFGFWRLLRFGFDGIASFSTLPLRVWSWLGLVVAALACVYAGVIIAKTMIYGIEVPGYASLMAATLFLGGVQLICLGVLGDYLGRVFTEVKGRPLYIVADAQGFARAEEARPPADGRQSLP